FFENEIESRYGALDRMFGIARALLRLPDVRIGTTAKSDRGYGLLETKKNGVHRAGEPLLNRGMNVHEAFRIVMRECLRHMTVNVPGAIAGTAESLHQLRVGLRRLRAAISVFRSVIGNDLTQQLKADLQWLNRG